MKEGGYQTAMIGKWHLKSHPTGFDYWNVLPGQGLYYNPIFIEMGERKEQKNKRKDKICSPISSRKFCFVMLI